MLGEGLYTGDGGTAPVRSQVQMNPMDAVRCYYLLMN
jgi:hypothetical protein